MQKDPGGFGKERGSLSKETENLQAGGSVWDGP